MAYRKNQEDDGYRTFRAEVRGGTFRRMYCFFGEEDYLRESYRKELRKKLVAGPAEDFNFHRFTEENWDLNALSEAVEAIPMMSEASLVEIVDVDPFKLPEDQRTRLAEILSGLPDYVTVLFVLYAPDWKPDKRMTKLWNVLKGALLVEFRRQPENELSGWVRRHLAAEEKTMSDELIRYLIAITGSSMTSLDQEIRKLSSYTDQRNITKNDVDAVVIPVLDARVSDITGDIGERDFDGALRKLRDLLAQDTEPIYLNGAIGRQLRQLYAARVLYDHGKGPYALKELCGVWNDRGCQSLYQQAKRFTRQQLRRGIQLAAQADYAMKTGGGDREELVETLVLRLAGEMTA